MARDNKKWKARKREWANRNRQKITANKKKYIKRNIKYVNKVKSVPCKDCNIKYPPYCMDFDHTDDNKEGNISHMARWPVGLEKLKREIEKCEIVCSNCHRCRTYKRINPRSSMEE